LFPLPQNAGSEEGKKEEKELKAIMLRETIR
jgi:hypothetical protein